MLHHNPVSVVPTRTSRRLTPTRALPALLTTALTTTLTTALTTALSTALITVLITAPMASAAAETHPEVQAALDWTLPAMGCQQPKLRGKSADIVESDANSATMRIGVDSYKIDRFKRKEKRWLKCVSDYKQGLVEDFAQLKASAQYGLTQVQAEQILAKMALIDATVSEPAVTIYTD